MHTESVYFCTKTEGLGFEIGKAGTYSIQAVVLDESGNEYISLPTSFTASDTYRINLEGEIPATAKKNEIFNLPDAFVTNASGERQDSSGNVYTYTLTVKDPLDVTVPVGEDGKIKFERSGVYIVTYKSTSADGTDTKEFRITVS